MYTLINAVFILLFFVAGWWWLRRARRWLAVNLWIGRLFLRPMGTIFGLLVVLSTVLWVRGLIFKALVLL